MAGLWHNCKWPSRSTESMRDWFVFPPMLLLALPIFLSHNFDVENLWDLSLSDVYEHQTYIFFFLIACFSKALSYIIKDYHREKICKPFESYSKKVIDNDWLLQIRMQHHTSGCCSILELTMDPQRPLYFYQ